MTQTASAPNAASIDYRKEPHPVGNLFPRAKNKEELKKFELSPEQIHSFHENGYLAPLRLLDDKQLAEMRAGLERMIQPGYPRANELIGMPEHKAGKPVGMIYFQNAWLAEESFHDMVFNPRLTVPLCQLLGTRAVRFFHDQIFYKPARHGGIVAWHQDYSYWTRTSPPGHITCFLSLDDSTVENGCLHVIPGSNKWKALPKVDLLGKNEDMESIKSVLTPEQLAQFKPTPILLKAGECSFHDSFTLHGSHPNRSERPRRSVVLNYMKPDTKSASDKPLMPLAPAIEPGKVVEGDLFPIAGSLDG